MKSKILCTGVAGFIGSHILQHLLEKTDWDIVGVASWSHKGTPERIEQVLSKNPEWRKRVQIITHDLSARFTEMTKKRIGQCDYIINAAADSHVERSISDPVSFFENNVGVALTMFEFAKEYKPKAFIQVSTDEVYGPAPKGHNHPEWSPVVPSNPYSGSKACQEAIAISYWRAFGIPLVITNTMNNFGEMQDAEKYIAKTIRLIKQNKIVSVHGTPDAIGSRYYLHARNHADALLFLLQNLTTEELTYKLWDERPARFNVVGDIELDNLQVAKAISNILNKPLHYEFMDFHSTRPGHDARYALDGSKLRSKGWIPPIEFMPSLKRYIEWTGAHPEWI